MSAETSLYSALAGSANVTALVANAESPRTLRIYPGAAREGTVALPYIVYFVVSGTRPQTFSGLSTLENARIQVSVFANTYSQAVTLADHVVNAIEAAMAVGNLTRQTFFEDETRLHHHALDFSLWE